MRDKGFGRQVSRKNGNWTHETLQKALNVVIDEGMKIRVASRVFGIPATFIRDHLYDKTRTRQRGAKPTLKTHEEKKLVDYIFNMQDLGHPLTTAKLRLKVALATQTRSTSWSANGALRKGWLRHF